MVRAVIRHTAFIIFWSAMTYIKALVTLVCRSDATILLKIADVGKHFMK